MNEYSPHLKFVKHLEVLREHVTRYRKEHSGSLRFLEVGSGGNRRDGLASGFQYECIDIDGKATYTGDICEWLPWSALRPYDIVLLYNVLEHVFHPFRAADHCLQLLRPGGLVIAVAPFSWRYHPVPVDLWRFTHKGLAHLFERSGDVEPLVAAYDIGTRRKDNRGGVLKDYLDVPPVDELGGWRENWNAVYVGRKRFGG